MRGNNSFSVDQKQIYLAQFYAKPLKDRIKAKNWVFIPRSLQIKKKVVVILLALLENQFIFRNRKFSYLENYTINEVLMF